MTANGAAGEVLPLRRHCRPPNVCAPNGHRRRPVGGYRYKDSEKPENLLLL